MVPQESDISSQEPKKEEKLSGVRVADQLEAAINAKHRDQVVALLAQIPDDDAVQELADDYLIYTRLTELTGLASDFLARNIEAVSEATSEVDSSNFDQDRRTLNTILHEAQMGAITSRADAQFAIRTRLIGDFANFSPEEQDEITGLTSKILALFPVGVGVSQEPPRARAENSFTDQTQAVRNAIAATDLDAAWNILQPLIVGRFAVEVSPTERNDVARLAVKIFTANIEQLRQLIADHGISDVVTQAVRALEARVRTNRNLFVNPAEAQALLSSINELIPLEVVVPVPDQQTAQENVVLVGETREQWLRETGVVNLVEQINLILDVGNEQVGPLADPSIHITTTKLEGWRDNLRRLRTTAENQGLFSDPRWQMPETISEIHRLVGQDFLSGRYAGAINRIDELIVLSQAEKPVEMMTYRELAEELMSYKFDAFRWGEWKGPMVGVPQRHKEIRNRFIALAEEQTIVEPDPEKEIDRLVWKTKVQLSAVSNELQHENEKASRDRSKLAAELKRCIVRRRELLIATTYHPTWGDETRKILDFLIKSAALRKGEKLVSRNGREIVLAEKESLKDGDQIIYEFDPNLSYESLSGEKGTTLMEEAISRNFGNLHEEARYFASTLFVTFDLLTISLSELQKKTKTRGHNADIEDKDRIMMQDPLATMMHRVFRYGGNKEDWTLWYLPYLEPIGKWEEITHGERLGKSKADHEWVRMKQKELLSYYSAFFPTEPFAGKVTRAGFCKAQGFCTLDWITLHGGDETLYGNSEKLWLYDKFVDVGNKDLPGGNLPNAQAQEEVSNIEFYPLAEENGWADLLERSFKSLTTGSLTKAEIMYHTKEGAKGGLIGEFFQIAGRAKMFPSRMLKNFLAPMLTLYIYRIFQSFDQRNNEVARNELWKEIVSEIRQSRDDSAGLAAFQAELTEVINNLHEQPVERFIVGETNPVIRLKSVAEKQSKALSPKENYRLGNRKIYLDFWWHHNKHTNPPASLIGMRLPTLGRLHDALRGGDVETEDYFEILNRQKGLPLPASRNGSMQKPKEHKESH